MLSPLVSTREIYFIRFCQHHGEGLWAVVDVSVDNLKEMNLNHQTSMQRCRRHPSGCIIQDMPNGYSKVTLTLLSVSCINKIYKFLIMRCS